ncbi:MAG: 30S ribosomal protein S16, partial [Jannaschia sp.]
TYNPLLAKDSEDRVKMDMERVQYWLGQGAQPTDRVARFLEAAEVLPKKERANLKKGEPGKQALERVKEKAEKAAAAVAAAAEAAAAPVVEAVTGDDEAAAEEAKSE